MRPGGLWESVSNPPWQEADRTLHQRDDAAVPGTAAEARPYCPRAVKRTAVKCTGQTPPPFCCSYSHSPERQWQTTYSAFLCKAVFCPCSYKVIRFDPKARRNRNEPPAASSARQKRIGLLQERSVQTRTFPARALPRSVLTDRFSFLVNNTNIPTPSAHQRERPERETEIEREIKRERILRWMLVLWSLKTKDNRGKISVWY